MAAADICLAGGKKQQVADQNGVSIKIAAGLLQFSRDILKGCFPDRRSGGGGAREQVWAHSGQQDVNSTEFYFTLLM